MRGRKQAAILPSGQALVFPVALGEDLLHQILLGGSIIQRNDGILDLLPQHLLCLPLVEGLGKPVPVDYPAIQIGSNNSIPDLIEQ